MLIAHNRLILSSIIIFLATNLWSQQNSSRNYKIMGNVKDVESKEPLAGANVVVNETDYGTSTDPDGNFTLFLTEEKSSLNISMVGYQNLVIENAIKLMKQNGRLELFLELKTISLESVLVTPKPERYDGTGLVAKIDRNMIKHSPGSAQDIFWTLQTLPGVSSGSDDSKLYVRGGSASENLVLFDGAVFTNPYHFEFMGGGLFSIFNSRLVEEVKFYTGGFPARYGDRLSSVIVINNKSASKENFAGEFNLSLTDFNGMLEFPIKSLNGSGFVSIRRSYFDMVYRLSPDLKNDNDAIPYFIDGYGKLDFDISKSFKLIITGLSSKENLKGDFNFDNFDGKMRSDGYNQLYSAKLNYIVSDKIFNTTNIYYSHVDKKSTYPQSSFENYQISELAFKNDLSFILPFNEIHLGAWIVNKNDKVDVEIPGEINFYTLEDYMVKAKGKYSLFSFYLEDKLLINSNLILSGGIRFDYLNNSNRSVVSPRINVAYIMNDHMSLSLDYGLYYQSPKAYEIGVNPELKFKKAESIGIGIKHQISDEFIVNLELYNKQLSDLVSLSNIDWKFSSDGFGFARGAELYLQFKPSSNFMGWISYSYSVAKRKEGTIRTQEYFAFDRTNLISTVLNYRFEEFWVFGVKYRYGDGTPYTPVIERNYNSSNSQYFPVLGQQNSSRYPSYSRFDLRITRQIYLGNYPVELYFEILNLFNNKNVVHWMYDKKFSTRTSMTVLPIIPVLGVSVKI